MPNFRRPHLLIPAALAILATAAFAVLWIGARTEFARGIAARMVAERTGLATSLDTLRLGFFPSPSIEIHGLTLAQPPGYGDEPFATVARLRLELPWGSIFGKPRLHAVAVSGATARLVVAADGVPNWSKVGSAAGASAEPVSRQKAPWYLGALDVDHGVVDYRDLSAGSQWQLGAIAVAARELAPGAAFPVEVQLGGTAGTHTFHYAVKGQARLDTDAGRYEATTLTYRGWLGGEPLPLAGAELTGTLARALYDAASGVARLDAGRLTFGGIPASFDGQVDLDADAPAGEIRLATEPFAPRASAIVFGRPLPATTDPTAFESLQAAVTARLADGALILDPVSGRLDDTNFEGRIEPGRRLVRAQLDRIDFNRYLPPAAKTPSAKRRTLEEAVSGLGELDFDAEIRIGDAQLAGARMRNAVIRVTPDAAKAP
jgi:AsmA protein